jgi:predicted nuclease of predicted toxin-antitoxin system
MRFLLDANLPRSALAVFSRFGHEAELARDIGMASSSDTEIAAHALKTGSVLLTRDLDFADIRRYPPEQFVGLIVLRLPENMVAAEIAGVIARFLSEPLFVNSLAGHLAIVELERARFRPPLES